MTFNTIRGLTEDSKLLDRKQETVQHGDGCGAEDSPPFKENPGLSKAHRDEIHTAMWTKEGRRQRPQAQDGNDGPFQKSHQQTCNKKNVICNLHLKDEQLKPSEKGKKTFSNFLHKRRFRPADH